MLTLRGNGRWTTVTVPLPPALHRWSASSSGRSMVIPNGCRIVQLDRDGVPAWATNTDLRESGYILWDVALGAKVDSDSTRHAKYCSWLSTYVPNWTAKQNRRRQLERGRIWTELQLCECSKIFHCAVSICEAHHGGKRSMSKPWKRRMSR